MTNPFTAKAKPKLRSFGGLKAKPAKKNNPWVKKIEEDQTHEERGEQHPGSAKADFSRAGLRYCNVRDHDGWWTIDVVNGDQIVTFNNKAGSWLAPRGAGFVEPLRDVAFALQDRYISELKRIGAELPYYLRSEQDKRKADMAKAKEKDAESAVETPKPKKKAKAKPSKSKTKVNPWSVRAKA
jgi:hypothetical protein